MNTLKVDKLQLLHVHQQIILNLSSVLLLISQIINILKWLWAKL